VLTSVTCLGRIKRAINEAVQLILQAGAIGEGGEIFILKMGMPVKIIDMARDLIRLSGFEPDKDIQIRITGLRPGEKLYEELITEEEGIVPTPYDKIMVLKCNGHCNGMSNKELERGIKELLLLAVKNDVEGIKVKLREMVPEYIPRTEPQIDAEEHEKELGHFEVIHLNIDGKEVLPAKEACLSDKQKKEYESLHDRV